MHNILRALVPTLLLLPLTGLAQTQTPTEAPEVQINCQDQSRLIIPIDPGTAVSIKTDSTDPATAGDLEVSAAVDFSCTQTGEGKISFDTADGARPLTVGGATSASAAEGSSVRFDWESRGAFTCAGQILNADSQLVRTWGPAPDQLPRGPFTVTLRDDAGNTLPSGQYTATVRCSNGGPELVSGPVDLSITGSDIPEACQGRQPINAAGTDLMEMKVQCSLDSDLVDCRDYSSVFGPFPGTSSGSKNLYAARDEIWAMKIETGATIDAANGFWDFVEPQGEINATGRKILTLSQCPGDFDQDKIGQEMTGDCYVKTGGLTTTIAWQRAGESGSRCVIEPNSTYYLNVLYTDDAAGTPPGDLLWSCGGANSCANNVAPRF